MIILPIVAHAGEIQWFLWKQVFVISFSKRVLHRKAVFRLILKFLYACAYSPQRKSEVASSVEVLGCRRKYDRMGAWEESEEFGPS